MEKKYDIPQQVSVFIEKNIINSGIKRQTKISYINNDFENSKAVFYFICEKLLKSELGESVKFNITESFEAAVNILIKYAHCQFENDIDNIKGIVLFGNTGSRKTFLMQTLNLYLSLINAKFTNCNIEEPFCCKKQLSNDVYYQFLNDKENYFYNKIINSDVVNIDDLGSEPKEAVIFGNRLNVLEKILEMRYNKDKITHITTNFDKEKIKTFYGERVLSRMLQKSHFIELIDYDFRTKK